MSKQLISIRVFRSLSLLLLAGICSVSCAQDESSVVAPQPPAAQKQATPQHTQGAGESELSDRLRQAEAQPVPRGRLPRYFAAVVDQIQRLRIYEIQSKYRVQIDEIERRLQQLREAEMREIEQVLTSTQRARVEELRMQSRGLAASRTTANAPSP